MNTVSGDPIDTLVRRRAFRFVAEQTFLHPNGIPWSVLSTGFQFERGRVPLLSQQGIFKPAVCRIPLSLPTAPIVEGRERPYADDQTAEGLILQIPRHG